LDRSGRSYNGGSLQSCRTIAGILPRVGSVSHEHLPYQDKAEGG